MPASLGFMVEAILGIMGSAKFRSTACKRSLVLIATCSVRYSCLLYLVVVSTVVMSHPI